MTVEETNWLLSLPKENKLMFIESALKEGDFGIAMGIAKILLDAPITKGGVSTEEISEVMDKGIAEMPTKNKKNV
tara:strand:- start:1158 stop:1382 length:225 start_codon:yes stop_codon:yes gene_type:complete